MSDLVATLDACPNAGVFVKLKLSARNCRCLLSVTAKVLDSDKIEQIKMRF